MLWYNMLCYAITWYDEWEWNDTLWIKWHAMKFQCYAMVFIVKDLLELSYCGFINFWGHHFSLIRLKSQFQLYVNLLSVTLSIQYFIRNCNLAFIWFLGSTQQQNPQELVFIVYWWNYSAIRNKKVVQRHVAHNYTLVLPQSRKWQTKQQSKKKKTLKKQTNKQKAEWHAIQLLA